MAPRSTPPVDPPADQPEGGRRRGGIGAARTYRPRGRTVRDTPARAGRTGDPFRPALQVLDGGRKPAAAGRKSAAAGRKQATGRKSAAAGGRRSTADREPAVRRTTSGRGGRGATAAGAGRPRVRRLPRPPRLGDSRRRLRLSTAAALALFVVLGLRLVELQLTEAPAFAANGLATRLHFEVLPAARGAIYDRTGAVLVHSVEVRQIYADPQLVEDPAAVAAALSPLLGVPASRLAERMAPQLRPDGRPSRFESLQRGVDIAVAEEIGELNLPGIGVAEDERRVVPGHDLAANLVGFTGQDLDGLEGLEARYDEVLRGIAGEHVYETGLGDDLARPIPAGYTRETPARPGSDLRLTIDMDLQYEAQRVLAERLRAANATFGAAVVLDPHTGEVLAQASYPTYDAADWEVYEPEERVDAATAVVVDPGSVHKPLVLGAALEEGVITPDTTLVLNPTVRKGDTVFQDAIPQPAGTRVALPAVLAFSSNVGTIMIADELGPEKLYAYQQAFGLGRPTGEGMPGEAAGDLLEPDRWSGSSYGSVPIGHSVAVTPLQLAAAFGAIANDGVWIQPRLVQAVIAPDGTETAAAQQQRRRVLSPDTAAYVRYLMEAVVSVPNATGVTAAVDGYRVAGKTGTGRWMVNGEYADGEVASFVGMAPADNPRYVVAVVTHTPGGGGGQVAGPVFRDIMAFTMRYHRVPPSADEPPPFVLYP